MSKAVHIYTLEGLSEHTVTDAIKEFYSKNYNEPKEVSLTAQAYNAIYPYHKQQVRSLYGVPVTVTADRVAPLVVVS